MGLKSRIKNFGQPNSQLTSDGIGGESGKEDEIHKKEQAHAPLQLKVLSLLEQEFKGTIHAKCKYSATPLTG